MPLVTVGIPFRNEERRLGDAVRSILAQSFGDFELLLVDDGSTDRSVEIARSFGDPRISVVSDGQRRFLPARLNQIVGLARGELVARMDGDDVSHPDRLRREVEALRAAGNGPVAVGTWAGLADPDDRPFAVVETPREVTPSAALERALLPHATLLARRSWLLEHPYDERWTRSEDRDLWCRTVGTTQFLIIPEPLYVLRVDPRHPSFVEDYLESHRQNRALHLRYGPRSVGWARTMRAYGTTLAKDMVVRGAAAMGLTERLVRRRGRPPAESERLLIEEALAAGRQRA
jgi:glycosyltransferase involved in cell wall biosynthesis